MAILSDPDGRLTIAQASVATYRPFQSNSDLPAGSQAYWIKILIHPGSDETHRWILTVEPGWDSADLYIPRKQGFQQLQSGIALPPLRRAVVSHLVAFPVSAPPGSDTTLYLRIANGLFASPATLRVDVSLMSAESFIRTIRVFNYVQGIYAGIILAMVAYNFVLYFSLQERTYLFYSVYVLSFGVLWMLRAGFFFDYLWPQSSLWNEDVSFYLVGIAVSFSALFVRSFLDTRGHSAKLDRALWGVVGFTALLMASTIVVNPHAVAPFLALDSLATTVFYGALGLRMVLQKHRRARFFLSAWAILLASNVFYILIYLGILHAVAARAEDAVQVGSAVECILLAFALADRVKGIKAENELRQLQHTAELEEAVAQRTHELVSLNARLEAASITDPLTGLSNRRLVDVTMVRLTTEIMRALHGGLAGSLLICISDLDHFKRINDSYGHETGDAALRQVASSLSRTVRGGTLLARWGGEEFLLIERLVNRSEDTAFAERMRRLIADEVSLPVPDGELRMTVSLGLAHFPLSIAYPDLLTWQEVLILADRCLYQAKQSGRNCWQIVRANEDALHSYIRQHGEAAASALVRSHFAEAIQLGILEVTSPRAVRS